MTSFRALAMALAICAGAPAAAETHRLAVVVGNNAGSGELPPLRYAEADAGKVARVLAELGSVPDDNIYLLQGRDLTALQDALRRVHARVEQLQKAPDARVVVVFYYSGHSDGQALELGRERLAFGELRRWLDSTGADVRLAIVDSCKSGALLNAKGGKRGAGFQIRLTDELAATGQALLTSSASDELALESQEIRGSYFTHHFVSGLRGAADASGDGQVTLGEVYQYSYARTVAATSDTVIGPQHPVYDYRLSGQGELVLAELRKPSAALEVPAGFDRVLVIHPLRDQVVSELAGGAGLRVALVPGEYGVRAWKNGASYGARFKVAAGQIRSVLADELPLIHARIATAKGSTATAFLPIEPAAAFDSQATGGDVRVASAVQGYEPPPNDEPLAQTASPRPIERPDAPSTMALFAAVGARGNSLLQDGVAISGRLVLTATGLPWTLSGDASMLRVGSYSETAVLGYLGYRATLVDGDGWSIAVGAEAGAGAVIARTSLGGEGRFAFGAGANARVGFSFTPKLKAVAEAQLPVLHAVGGRAAASVLPAAWLGVELGL